MILNNKNVKAVSSTSKQNNSENFFTVDAKKTFEQAYTDYSAFVIQRRSTPDARDMFKFTQRQIMYAQFINKLRHKDKFQKSQKSVAAAMSHSYVHGDASCYSVIIHLCRPCYTRYYMEDFTGAIMMTGSTAYGASRYTECRLSSLADRVFNYIKEDGLTENDWNPTYDDESEYPTLFPSVGYYNICNGAFGSIGVGIASSVPQFNLEEINKAIQDLIDDPSVDIHILPDFASGGIIMNPTTTLASLFKGTGKSILLRGEVVLDERKGYLTIKSLPYGVYTDTVCSKIAEEMDKPNSIIKDFKDLSQDSVNIRVYGDDLAKIEAWLYKNTQVQNHFTINMIMLDKGKTPKVFSLKEALLAHIEHAKGVYRRQFEYELNKLKLRQEILEGLIRAYSILDDVIQCIKSSKDRADAIANLVNRFNFSARVSEAIVELKLHRLTNMDIQKLHDELDENLLSQNRINEILTDTNLFNTYLKGEYQNVAEAWGDERRTKIYNGKEFETDADGATPTCEYILVSSKDEYISSSQDNDEDLSVFEAQGETEKIFVNPTEDEVIIFSNTGRVFLRKGTELKIGHFAWADVLSLKKDEHIVKIWRKPDIPEMVTIDGKQYHNSYLICSASKRGKKFTTGTWNIKEVK